MELVPRHGRQASLQQQLEHPPRCCLLVGVLSQIQRHLMPELRHSCSKADAQSQNQLPLPQVLLQMLLQMLEHCRCFLEAA